MIGLLAGALQRHHDFILTFEEDEEGKRVLHLISGKLITPCMLGTLTNRVELQQDEGGIYIRRELS